MPRLEDTAVEEGLQHLPGWERRGDEIVKTFVRADFAHAMVFVNKGRRGGRPPPRHRHPLEQGHPGPVQPRRGRADRPRLPARRPHPGARPTRPARLTDRHLGMSMSWLARRDLERFTSWIAGVGDR
jgi:hypothetical protein